MDYRDFWGDSDSGRLFELCAIVADIDPARIGHTTRQRRSAIDEMNYWNDAGSRFPSVRVTLANLDIGSLSQEEQTRFQQVLKLGVAALHSGAFRSLRGETGGFAEVSTADFGRWAQNKASLRSFIPLGWVHQMPTGDNKNAFESVQTISGVAASPAGDSPLDSPPGSISVAASASDERPTQRTEDLSRERIYTDVEIAIALQRKFNLKRTPNRSTVNRALKVAKVNKHKEHGKAYVFADELARVVFPSQL